MEIKKKCAHCGADGRISIGGMMYKDCRECNGEGFIYIDESKSGKAKENVIFTSAKIDKRSKSYKEAIEKIQKMHKSISLEDAKKIFDKELNSLAG